VYPSTDLVKPTSYFWTVSSESGLQRNFLANLIEKQSQNATSA
jgi:hypothetical protein